MKKLIICLLVAGLLLGSCFVAANNCEENQNLNSSDRFADNTSDSTFNGGGGGGDGGSPGPCGGGGGGSGGSPG